MKYRISHITDLLQIPPEHWDEAMRDIRGAMVSLHLIEAAVACTPGASFNPKEDCPFIDFIPDGKGDITPIMEGKPLFSMRITKDEASNAKDDRAAVVGGSESSDLLDGAK